MGNPSILVIDDDVHVRKTLTEILASAGYETHAADTGAAGIELCRRHAVHVALIDLQLPDMPGIEVLKLVRTECPSTQAIILTGNASLDSAIEATNMGAYSFLQKPFEIDLLLLNIRRAVEKRQADEQIAYHSAELKRKNEELERLYEEVKTLSLHDPLTGLANRRHLEFQLAKSVEEVKRYGARLSVIMLDIDRFKQFNDTRGHVEGDSLLAKLAAVLVKTARSADTVFRYGGEEFLVLLPRTDAAMAAVAAERLRKAVESQTEVTVSLGIAEYRSPDDSTMIERADEALYTAKRGGRNRCEVWREETADPTVLLRRE